MIGGIFDWDGVVVDSSKIHEESWEVLAQETGLALPPDHFVQGFGKRNQVIIRVKIGHKKCGNKDTK